MANKNCLARGIKRNEEPEGVAKLTEPHVVSLGYRNFKIVAKNDKKFQAVLQHITIYFNMHYTVMFIDTQWHFGSRFLMIKSWYWSQDLVIKVLILRPGDQDLGLEFFSKVLITSLIKPLNFSLQISFFKTYNITTFSNEIVDTVNQLKTLTMRLY